MKQWSELADSRFSAQTRNWSRLDQIIAQEMIESKAEAMRSDVVPASAVGLVLRTYEPIYTNNP